MTPEQFNNKGQEVLVDLAYKAAALLKKKAGIDPELADDIGRELALEMSDDWGGQVIYFAIGRFLWVSETHYKIFEKFTGDNHAELAREYKMSVPHIYRVVKAVKAAEMAKRQGGLFNDSDA